MNNITIDGRLTRDPELKYTKTGKTIAVLTIANNEGFGENKKTTFVDVEVWNKVAENCGQYLKKGSMIAVKGCLAQDVWTDKDGNKKSKHKIEYANVEFKDVKTKTEPAVTPKEENHFNDDDIPF
jgi:single-strand DNA-binding protein